MPAELKGFYFDPEKNRYFPIKHQAAGTSQRHTAKAISPSLVVKCKSHKWKGMQIHDTVHLLCSREVAGRSHFAGNQGSICFQRRYMESQASLPKVWIYEDTTGRVDGAIEQFCAVMETPEGRKEGNVLTVGGRNGWIGFYEIEKTGEQLEYEGLMRQPRPFLPSDSVLKTAIEKHPSPIWSTMEPAMAFSSNITAIKRLGKRSALTNRDGIFLHEGALFTTLGSGRYGGSLYVLRLNKPLDFNSRSWDLPLERRVSECASTNCTVWTSDSNFDGTGAVVGTNQGAALVDIERGRLSWICRSSSDVLSQQFDQSGNLVFCGFRNGAVVTVDVRKRQSTHFEHSTRVHRRAIAHVSHHLSSKHGHRHSSSGKFQIKGNLNPSDAIYMSSAVCSLAVLHSDDKYLLASSMNGTMKLWDRRLVQRGAVQSYEGHVNSHTTLQFGVDPTETLLASGGEDSAIRIWSVKTGELLHTTASASSPVTTVCWPRSGKLRNSFQGNQFYEDALFEQKFCWGLWLGSSEGLMYMHGGASHA
eukprot:Gb_10977 [translate_table: standard]